MATRRWTEDDYKKIEESRQGKSTPAAKVKKTIQSESTKRFQALGRLPKGEMNQTEKAYSIRLEQMKYCGEIIDWKFHPMNMRLAKNLFYEVDFLVLSKDMVIEIHETKGTYTTDKGQMKIKLAAEAIPWFRFFKCIKKSKKDGGHWVIQDYSY